MKATRLALCSACVCVMLASAVWAPDMGARTGGSRSATCRGGRGAILLLDESGRDGFPRHRSGIVLPDPVSHDPCLAGDDPSAESSVRAIQERLLADLVVSARLTDPQHDLARGVLLRLDRREQELLGEVDFDSLTNQEAERVNGRLDEVARNARRDMERLLLPDQVHAFENWCERTGLTAPAALAVLDEAAGE